MYTFTRARMCTPKSTGDVDNVDDGCWPCAGYTAMYGRRRDEKTDSGTDHTGNDIS